MSRKCNVAVLGAGTIGISTAFNIIQDIPNVRVTIIAEQFSPNTTSDVAAGMWRPHRFGDTETWRVAKWGQQTWDHLMQLVMSDQSSLTGTLLVSGSELFHEEEEDPFWKNVVLGYRRLSAEELSLYHGAYKSGYFYTTILADQTRYIPWLTARFTEQGGTVLQRKVNDFSELTGYDVIVNCTGNGARYLCNDVTIEHVRGYVVKGKAHWIKHFTIALDDMIHVIPGYDNIVMGYTARDDADPMLKLSDREHILSGCARIVPSITMATELRDYLGFRPVRPMVRVEVENRDGNVPIVHNYGHGGSGIALHWGCAKEATHLVKGVLNAIPLAKL